MRLPALRVSLALSAYHSGVAVRQFAKVVLGDLVATDRDDKPGALLAIPPLVLPRQHSGDAVARTVRWHYSRHVVQFLWRAMFNSWRLRLLCVALIAVLLAVAPAGLWFVLARMRDGEAPEALPPPPPPWWHLK